MSIGVVMALGQTHAKRLLAYSSVSQMGFVLAGFGAAAYLGDHGAVGWTGSLLHVANHALAKGLLFLGVGAVVHATGEADLRRLGGLARRMPWTFAVVLVGAGGIAGLPGLNGFVSKSVLHHALVHAAEHGGAPGLAWAERIFVATTVGTAAALVKLVAMAFLGRPAVARPARDAPWTMRAPMLAAAGGIVALGVAPSALAPLLASGVAVLRPAAAPAAATVAGWVGAPIAHAADLRAAALAIALGMLVHGVARRVGAYAWVPPRWLSLDEWVRSGLVGVGRAAAALMVPVARAGAWWRVERSLLVGLASPQGAVRQRALRRWRVRTLLVLHRSVRRAGAFVRATERLDASHWLVEPAAWARLQPIGLSAKDQDRWVHATRRRIARHARDLGLGVGVLFLTWLAFVAVVAFAGGG
jgi:NADH:ubiquinone oxidoreductase subunit 5 (subunit L)/multisubunit Na+/H+ antiporter MnhA subunit